MPKKKRLKQRKKQKDDEQANEDCEIRSYVEDTSINVDSIDDFRPLANDTQSPQFDGSYVVDSSLNNSGLKCLFSSRNGCYSSSVIEAPCITETPRVNKQDLLDLSYIDATSKPEFFTHHENHGDNSATCIQDLINPPNKFEENFSYNRDFDKVRLEHLRNFNNVLLNTSQNDDDSVEAVPNCPVVETRGVQTCKKSASYSVNRRKSYRTSPMVLFYCKSSQAQHRRRVSVGDENNKQEMYAWILSKIKSYHERYLSLLPTKLVDFCSWSVNQGLAFFYQLRGKQVDSPQTGQGSREVIEELRAFRREFLEFREDIKKYMTENKGSCAPTRSFTPPPPPPLPPLAPSLPNLPFAHKTQPRQQKKDDITKPIISLDDILKVKLKKVKDRPLSMRRCTEPVVFSLSRRNLKSMTSSETSKSPTESIDSDSLCSSLSRILKNE